MSNNYITIPPEKLKYIYNLIQKRYELIDEEYGILREKNSREYYSYISTRPKKKLFFSKPTSYLGDNNFEQFEKEIKESCEFSWGWHPCFASHLFIFNSTKNKLDNIKKELEYCNKYKLNFQMSSDTFNFITRDKL